MFFSLPGSTGLWPGFQKAHLRRCAASFVTAAYRKVRLIPQDLRALHLNLFEQPAL
jgi:hypothetical protein